ncbi:hypothetical protein JO972_15505 [Verrucomicrobiaceae bacterium 5K15]|uniref:Uncharacterized protein n=1 Tax=Oceaniferula flava TaxID=2800421 RepID=A0AAE2V924_9BACT|nr:hypothetical protein [Oceaniferula flavus]MBK1856377.1 hypothetical protein [Oceaniferula flavus]MBM1137684.1 hypothetical protein [Oceaniferula flavus]
MKSPYNYESPYTPEKGDLYGENGIIDYYEKNQIFYRLTTDTAKSRRIHAKCPPECIFLMMGKVYVAESPETIEKRIKELFKARQEAQQSELRKQRQKENKRKQDTLRLKLKAANAKREAVRAIERKRLDDLEAELRSAVEDIHRASRRQINPITIGPPSDDDQKLASKWAKHSKKDSTLSRMLSARLAELAAKKYFELLGFHVDDVAMSQLSDDGDWLLYDLKIVNEGGLEFYVDVKNARITDNRSNYYTSHCVPKFKKVPRIDALKSEDLNVTIAGVLSPWQSYEDIQLQSYEVTFLGITQKTALTHIIEAFKDGPIQMEFDANKMGHALLPPWVFDYPKLASVDRDRMIASEVDLRRYSEIARSPYCLALKVAEGKAPGASVGLSKFNQVFIEALAEKIRINGLRLPILFGSILEHFVVCLKSKENDAFDAGFISSLIFHNRRDQYQTPLFAHDPAASVIGLIHSLETLWRRRNSELLSINQFKLVSLNILRGKRESAENSIWITLLAYCGGWIKDAKTQEPVRPCGKTPLVLGESEICSRGYLVCPYCKFCCESCENEGKRKNRITDVDDLDEAQNCPF